MQNLSDRAARIRVRAYELWEKEGRPDGNDQAHWFAAESELGMPARPSAARRAKTNSVKARGATPGRRPARRSEPEETA